MPACLASPPGFLGARPSTSPAGLPGRRSSSIAATASTWTRSMTWGTGKTEQAAAHAASSLSRASRGLTLSTCGPAAHVWPAAPERGVRSSSGRPSARAACSTERGGSRTGTFQSSHPTRRETLVSLSKSRKPLTSRHGFHETSKPRLGVGPAPVEARTRRRSANFLDGHGRAPRGQTVV
jgi:hypothetical protein